jgi:uncharacterized protein with ParB-like and HNH nuclease domain
MAYEKPITIKEAIAAIEDGEYVLPSIQREFVWDTEQMETLFDSLMRDYPISTFLFWKVKAENVGKFQFYRFLRTYHERDCRHNEKATLSGTKDIIGILDGQQRLTSLYVSLKGTYASKLSYYRRDSDHAYPVKRMYLNLMKPSQELEMEYDFRYLADYEAKKRDAENLWFPVGRILEFRDISDALEWINDQIYGINEELDTPVSRETNRFATNTLNRFFKVVCENDSLNFFLEKSEELDKVLQIFIRINQGGTKLSYSDLLLSIATAQWKKLDARKVIHEFVDKINDIGKGFNFNKDFVLKSCLVLADIKDIKFKVDNFSTDNMAIIESQWDQISGAIHLAIRLAAHFGFDDKTLTSANAIIPIAYFLKVKGIDESILHSKSHETNRSNIKQWLIRALLKRIFGGTPDNLYPVYRQLVQDNGNTFPLQQIIDRYSGTNKSIEFYQEDIENLIGVGYGSSSVFMLLSLFYPLNHDYEFHQDHIHPKKYFTQKRLESLGIADAETRDEYIARFNKLANLQLLQATPNVEKSAKMLKDWLAENKPGTAEQQQYRELHLFPAGKALEFSDFIEFFDAREALIRARLHEILNVKQSAPSQEVIET